MDMPKPTAEHEKLLRLVGTWTGKETMHPSPWMPDGCVADGTTTSRAALSGFGVVTDYAQSIGGQVTFEGHGVYTVAPQTSDVVLFWFDSMGGQCEQFRGKWDGDKLSLQSKNPMMGHMRCCYEFQADGSMLSSMACSQDGESWTGMFDGVYSKAD